MSKIIGQTEYVSNFQDFISTPYHDEINAICWSHELRGDFSEIVNKLKPDGNVTVIDQQDLLDLELSEEGQLAREIILKDLQLLEEHGGAPVLNVIVNYDRDDDFPFFPTDVYSFHVDRSPIPTNTILCTYHGASSEIVPNSHAIQKVLIPEIREELKRTFDIKDEDFDEFVAENFFDLHYQAQPDAEIVSLGVGHLWRLAVDHPDSPVQPCIHRAPQERAGEPRLLLIC